MICKNPYCKSPVFVGVIEMDKNHLIGVKCVGCGARYSLQDIEISKRLKRIGWNSVNFITDEK